MSIANDPKHKAAFGRAEDFQYAILPDIRRSRSVAWCIASCSGALAALSLLALLFIIPLKERYAVPILVDRTTGYARIVQTPQDMNGLRPDIVQNLDRHWIQEYIHARESYQPEHLKSYYRRVRLFSCQAGFDSFAWNFNPGNAQNHYRIYDDTRVDVVIRKIQPAGTVTDAAGIDWRNYNVQIDRIIVPPARSRHSADRYIPYEINLSVRFRELALEESRLRLNPLGFTVCHYERDQYLERPEEQPPA